MSKSLSESNEDAQRKTIDRTRGVLMNYSGRAAEILQELAEFADNDRIRLSAVNSILDRAGVIAPIVMQSAPSQEEHDIIKRDAEKVMADIQRNAEQAAKRLVKPGMEALMVIEGEDTDDAA